MSDKLREALVKARAALHQHYVEWDGEPEDAVGLQLARAECDAALALTETSPSAEGECVVCQGKEPCDEDCGYGLFASTAKTSPDAVDGWLRVAELEEHIRSFIYALDRGYLSCKDDSAFIDALRQAVAK